MRRSNADLLAPWLILCTQGHKGFNSPPGHRLVCALASVCVCVCVCVCLRHPCIYLCALFCFVFFYPAHFHFTFTKSPILMSRHWQLLPTLALTQQDGGGQSVLLCAFVCIKMGWVEYQNVQTQTQDVDCGLSGPLHCVQYSCARY